MEEISHVSMAKSRGYSQAACIALAFITLAATLFVACVPASRAHAEPNKCPYDIRTSIMYNYLTEPQRELVDELYDAIYAGTEVLDFNGTLGQGISDDELWWVLDFVWNEFPELCAYDKASTLPWGYTGDGGWVTTSIHIGYRNDVSIGEQQRFISQMTGIARQFKGRSSSEGIQSIYDYVCDRYTYDHDWTPSVDTQFAYYAWKNGRALCNGYSQTIALLCHFAGYDCSYVDGQAGEPGNTGGHAWSVFADGAKLFYGDATWDDALSSRTYYGMSLSAIDDDHFADPEYNALPNSGSYARRTTMTRSMYRLYNPYSGEHFYTADPKERDNVVRAGWNDEGVGWRAPSASNAPVYRLYNKYGGEHHYTTDKKERNTLVNVGWLDEGIGWYSDDARSTPLYRQYNPNAYSCNHNYTTSIQENNWLVGMGWKAEGIGWYGV